MRTLLQPGSQSPKHLRAPGASRAPFPLGDTIRAPLNRMQPLGIPVSAARVAPAATRSLFHAGPLGFEMLLIPVLQAVKMGCTSVPGPATPRCQQQVYVEPHSQLSCLCGRAVCNSDISASFLRVFLQMWSRSFAQWSKLGLVSGTGWLLAKMVMPHYFARNLFKLLHFFREYVIYPE